MKTIKKSSKSIKFYVYIVLSFLIIQNCNCLGPAHTPKSMDYELRRPITYLYNRLAYKYGTS